MQAVHDHHATYPLIKKPTNRLLLTFSPDFALNSQIWLFYAEKWIFLKKLGTLLTATVYIVEQSPFATAQRLDTVNSNAVLANGIILRCIYYGSRGGTIQKYFANPKKYFKSQCFSQITVEKFDKSKKLLQILRKFVDPQITFSIIRKYFANP